MANISVWPDGGGAHEGSGAFRSLEANGWGPSEPPPRLCPHILLINTQLLNCDSEHFGVNKTQDKIFQHSPKYV